MFGVELEIIWFVLIGVLFAGYFLLEGFDFGVGILLPIVGKDESRRAALIRTIGPVWDGNEVWLITAAGALFAAFPDWYATLFSGFYLPLFLMLAALIVRVVGLEWRFKFDDPNLRAWCDRGIIVGSWLPPMLWGVIVANLLRGVPVDEHLQMSSGWSTLAGLFNPYAVFGALAMTALFVFHAFAFVRLKTAGQIREEVARLRPLIATVALVLVTVWMVWTQLEHGKPWTWAPVAGAIIVLVAALAVDLRDRDGWAFTFTSVANLLTTGLTFCILFPSVMPTSLPDGMSLDIWNASSSQYTLQLLTWVALLVAPVVVAYQGWTYWIFRKRIVAEPVG